MTEIKRITDLMDRAFSGDAWHGPSLMSLIDGMSAEDASKHPIPGAHSIWELVHHASAWNSIVKRRLGGESVDITTALDWPPVWEVTEPAWKRALETLAESHAHLRKYVEALNVRDLEKLQPTSAGPGVSTYVVLHGMVQHNLYHAGQIAILKKALANEHAR
jgi:uncharacterized damage-inducible protein DinB